MLDQMPSLAVSRRVVCLLVSRPFLTACCTPKSTIDPETRFLEACLVLWSLQVRMLQTARPPFSKRSPDFSCQSKHMKLTPQNHPLTHWGRVTSDHMDQLSTI